MSIRQGKKLIASSTTNGFSLFDCKWADHILNNISWLRADTFSWQSSDMYKAAYNHLAEDLDTVQKLYCWIGEKMGDKYYTYSESPSVGETTTDGDTITRFDSYGRPVVGAEYLDRYPDGDTLSTQTDTISNTTITYYLAEDGHKICLPDQEANISSLYESTGVAWYYVLDAEHKQFKLPRTKFGFTGIRNGVGGYIEAGLPNITGGWNSEYNITLDNGSQCIGAISEPYSTGAGRYGASTAAAEWGYGFKFDASRSNSIYGNSETVQQPATEMYLYFYVGNFEQTAIEQTAGLNAELFNSLNAHKVIEFQAPNAANNYTWYRKYADGWVEQGGQVTVAKQGANTSLSTNVTLPITMNNAAYLVNSMFITDGGNSTGLRINQVGRNATYITLFTYATTAISNNYIMSWEVKGMYA